MEPVTFEDVMVFLSRAEWDALPAGQRELYRDVVADTYELLTSLGNAGNHPGLCFRRFGSPKDLLSSRLSPPAPGALFPRSVHFTSAPQCLPCHKGPGIAPRI
uniref:KRAB domain-containing protein n=1 Tax=Catharus ustulatus TaxID=91951 RepID=A0A8C3TVS7_CATUS